MQNNLPIYLYRGVAQLGEEVCRVRRTVQARLWGEKTRSNAMRPKQAVRLCFWGNRASFGSINGVRTVWQRQPPKALQPCGFWAVWQMKKGSQKCVWPQIWPLTRPQLNKLSGYSAVGSARHLGCWGREFESPYSDHDFDRKQRFCLHFRSIFMCFQVLRRHFWKINIFTTTYQMWSAKNTFLWLLRLKFWYYKKGCHRSNTP